MENLYDKSVTIPSLFCSIAFFFCCCRYQGLGYMSFNLFVSITFSLSLSLSLTFSLTGQTSFLCISFIITSPLTQCFIIFYYYYRFDTHTWHVSCTFTHGGFNQHKQLTAIICENCSIFSTNATEPFFAFLVPCALFYDKYIPRNEFK